MDNRATWIILKGLPSSDVGIINIYVPNDFPSRCQLWDTLIRELPTSCRWILAGDFNMVEQRHDRTNPYGRMILAAERTLFSNLKRHLHVDDNPRSDGSLLYSWDNFRDDGHRILARLDMVYLFKNSVRVANRKLLEYKFLVIMHGLTTRLSQPPWNL